MNWTWAHYIYIYISTTWKVDGATPIRLGLSECQSPLLSLATELGSGDHNHLLSLRCKKMHNFSQATVDGSEIPNNHLGCIKTRHKWDKRPTTWLAGFQQCFAKRLESKHLFRTSSYVSFGNLRWRNQHQRKSILSSDRYFLFFVAFFYKINECRLNMVNVFFFFFWKFFFAKQNAVFSLVENMPLEKNTREMKDPRFSIGVQQGGPPINTVFWLLIINSALVTKDDEKSWK